MKRSIFCSGLGLVLVIFLGFAHGKVFAEEPLIASLSPFSGPQRARVIINGSGFTATGNDINFAGVRRAIANLSSSDGRTLIFTVPDSPCAPGQSCLQKVIEPGYYDISVTNARGTSNVMKFNLILTECASCKPTTGAPASGVFGINPGEFYPWSSNPADPLNEDILALKDLGVKWVRLDVQWRVVEKQRGQFDWSFYDATVARYKELGINVLATIGGTPNWANGDNGEGYPPLNPGDYANFAKEAVKRYKPNGIFAAQKGWQNDSYGIRHWEIGNEPNYTPFWQPSPNPGQYVALLAASNKAIREVDPRAIIMNGGFSPLDYPPDKFLQAMYAAGAKNCFDVMAYHPYEIDPRDPQGVAKLSETIKKILTDNGDANKPIWFSEYGFRTAPERTPDGKLSETDHAEALRLIYAQKNSVSAFFWHSVRDYGTPGQPGDSYGLLRPDFSKKPAFDVLKNLLNLTDVVINVDASKELRNIAKLKKGYHIDTGEPLKYTDNYKKYAQEIGYGGALVRLHFLGPLDSNKKSLVLQAIKEHRKYGNPDFMVTIYGMPEHLAHAASIHNTGCSNLSALPPADYNTWKNHVRDWVKDLIPYGIKYWEIWNEPDAFEGDGCFWSGTEDEYFMLYKATLEGIREAYKVSGSDQSILPEVRIGGPALANVSGKISGSSDYLAVSLASFAAQENLPLDFFSWHYSEPYTKVAVPMIKEELKRYGFTQAELIINEYGLDNAESYASLSASYLAQMAQYGVDRQASYQFLDVLDIPDGSPLEMFKRAGLFGLIDEKNIIKPKFNLFKAVSIMGDTLINVDSQPSGISDYVLAAKSPNSISVMIANPQGTEVSGIKLNVKNIPSSSVRLTRCIIDSTHSNAYAMEDKIKFRMAVGRPAAVQAGKDEFEAELRRRGYSALWVLQMLKYRMERYLADNNIDELNRILDWYRPYFPRIRIDFWDAFAKGMNKYGQVISSIAEEINNWPGVKLYSESKAVSISGNQHSEDLTLGPYAVQVIILSW